MKTAIDNFLNKQALTPIGTPMFRLVWSEDAREFRLGTFRDYANDILIREYVGVREVPKYPWVNNRWVVEIWVPPSIGMSKELPASTSGTYEPIYVFEDKDGNPLPLALRVVERLVYYTLNKVSPERVNGEKELEADTAYFEDKFDVRDNLLRETVGYGIDRKDGK